VEPEHYRKELPELMAWHTEEDLPDHIELKGMIERVRQKWVLDQLGHHILTQIHIHQQFSRIF
jgi:hypothetical protein